VVGGGDERGEGMGQRLDEVAQEHYGDPSYWRLLAAFNGILDPMHLEPGSVIQIPPLSVLRG
jgi:nucleoid-associated protein YgaU